MRVLLFTVAASTAARSGPGYSDFALTLIRVPQVPAHAKFSMVSILRFNKEDFGDHRVQITGSDPKRTPIFPPVEFSLKIPGEFPENLYGGYDVQVVQEAEASFKEYGRHFIEMKVDGAPKADWPLDVLPTGNPFQGR